MAVSITPVITYKRLVAAGNNEIWYEDINVAAGTMVELTAANGDIDTSDQLEMFEGYQKAFVVNGSKLKIADFINTKLTSSALGTAHAKGDILTQDQGSGDIAYMVVDFTNAAKTLTYGYAYYGGSATAFDAITATTGSGSGSGFTPSAVTAAPHWYDWTVYPGGSSGTIPNQAYLGCLYRGRPVLSGNPEAPFQWYMARQNNPWDFAYVADDSQTPVAGGNSDAGELGDIIRCLIPYKDDYLIFGCASSIWFLTGDPAIGGPINELDLSVGIFGSRSWCFGDEGLLYFWGTNGIYATTIPGTPVCLTQESLPAIVTNEAVDPSTHRICMAYDPKNVGIIVTITLLSDGSNSNYWYDIRTKGFFPEAYPDECGSYSLLYYNANDESLSGMLVGCKDGHIRTYDVSQKSDDIGGSDQAIDANVLLGPKSIANGIRDGSIGGLNIISAGGESGGTETDSDNISYTVYVGRSAAKILEDVDAVSNARFSGTFTAPGLQKGNKSRRKARGRIAAIKLSNNTAGESISFETLLFNTKEAGRML
ncbi:MAG TPA: hypothetical protein ENI05_02190 [Porticoccus sp.]|nr:hypothetical protein [Porticoccus sp.]